MLRRMVSVLLLVLLVCSTAAADGMVISTQSERIRSTRKMCLELLASEHTGDCYGHCHITCPAGIEIPQFIDELAHGQEWIEGYSRAVSLVRTGVMAISIVLAMAALLIVANTIRLAVYARRDELEILALVGASRTFVRVPFLLEGTLQGLLGGLIALMAVYGAYELLLPQIRFGLELVVGRAELRFFTTGEAFRLIASGGGLGLLGSVMALMPPVRGA